MSASETEDLAYPELVARFKERFAANLTDIRKRVTSSEEFFQDLKKQLRELDSTVQELEVLLPSKEANHSISSKLVELAKKITGIGEVVQRLKTDLNELELCVQSLSDTEAAKAEASLKKCVACLETIMGGRTALERQCHQYQNDWDAFNHDMQVWRDDIRKISRSLLLTVSVQSVPSEKSYRMKVDPLGKGAAVPQDRFVISVDLESILRTSLVCSAVTDAFLVYFIVFSVHWQRLIQTNPEPKRER